MSAALSSDTAAQRILHLLHPSCVAVSPSDPLYAPMLRRGMVASDAADLLIWRDADWSVAPAALRHAARTLAMPAPHIGIGPFLLQAAQHGFTPQLCFDVGFLGREALVLERSLSATDPATAALMGETVRLRYQLGLREAELAAARQAAQLTNQRERQSRREAAVTGRHLSEQLGTARAALEVTKSQRDMLLASTSWRLTAPLRRAINLLRRHHALPAQAFADGTSAGAYALWVQQHDTLDEAARATIRDHVRLLAERPLLSVIMPVYDTAEASLREAIDSVRNQLYPNWELCIADDASPSPHIASMLAGYAAADARIHVVTRASNGHISACTNSALALATGEFVALMDHDDILPPHALYRVALELNQHPDADILYSDEDQIAPDGARALPYFKPDWNIDLMFAHNMISHLGIYRRSLVERLGGMREGFEGSQDYDLALRAAASSHASRIRHIPAILYHWRQHEQTFSKLREEVCINAARRAIAEVLEQSYPHSGATVGPSPIRSWSRVTWAVPQPPPLVSIIIPTRDHAGLLRQCLGGILDRTDYFNVEVLIADNDSSETETLQLFAQYAGDSRVRILPSPGPFNYSAINNSAVARANGSLICLLNNDIDPIAPGWLAELVAQASRPDIGAVGARLLYPDDTVQHAGVVLGVGTFDGGPGVAGHYALHEQSTSYGYFGASVLVHEVAAVSAACLMLRRDVWDRAGGLDAENLPVAFNDVDLCLRIRRLGLRILYTPHALLYHHESVSRGNDLAPEHSARFERECRFMREAWSTQLDADPFYNPNFSRLDGLFRLGVPPAG